MLMTRYAIVEPIAMMRVQKYVGSRWQLLKVLLSPQADMRSVFVIHATVDNISTDTALQ